MNERKVGIKWGVSKLIKVVDEWEVSTGESLVQVDSLMFPM